MRRKVIGLVERILVTGPSARIWIRAKVDTGSHRTSLDSKLAKRLGLGPVLGFVSIRTSSRHSSVRRPIVKAKLRVAGEEFRLKVGVTDRSQLRYRAILGKDILATGKFLIDPSKPIPKSKHSLAKSKSPRK